MRITDPLSEEGQNYQAYLDGKLMETAIAADEELGQIVFMVKNPTHGVGAKFEGSELDQWLRKGAAIVGSKMFSNGDIFTSFPAFVVLAVRGKVELVYTGVNEEE